MSNDLFPHDDQTPRLSLEQSRRDDAYGREESRDRPDPGNRRYIRGFGWLAWPVVIALTLFLVLGSLFIQPDPGKTEMSRGEMLQPVLIGKIAIGFREFGKNNKVNDFEKQAGEFVEAVDFGTIEQRLCHAILVNEFTGPEEALNTLENVRNRAQQLQVVYTEKQSRLEGILKGIFDDHLANQTSEIPEEDQEFLSREMPWYGDLALNPPDSDSDERAELLKKAELSVTVLVVAMVAGVVLLVIGVVILFLFCAQMFRGALKHRVVDDSRYGSVYIETFAIWFLMFLGLSLVASFQGIEMGLASMTLTMVLPLSALIWPVLRGISARDMFDDLGLQLKNPFMEVVAGMVAYLAMLPLLLVGIIASMILISIMELIQSASTSMHEFSSHGVPHPIANEAFGGNVVQVMITIFFIAAVLAPLTEEIMFRGILYRSLRDSSRRMARWSSVGFAAITSSLIFAAIHPQGIAGIPVLTTLAIGFCLVRQWRGSLIAPMTMHAMHNATLSSLLIPVLI